jgi:hypothetical protein
MRKWRTLEKCFTKEQKTRKESKGSCITEIKNVISWGLKYKKYFAEKQLPVPAFKILRS